MILIHRKKKKRTNFFPTHIKHNSSKIITIIITIMNASTVLHGFSVQFLSNLRSVLIFQRNFCDWSLYSLYNFRGPAIDRFKFSKELRNRSNLNAIIVRKVVIDRSKFSKELGDRSQNITYKIKTDGTLDSAKIGQFLPFYTHLHSSFLVDSVFFVQTQYKTDMNLLIILIF